MRLQNWTSPIRLQRFSRSKLNTASDKHVAIIQLVRYTIARISTLCLEMLNLSPVPRRALLAGNCKVNHREMLVSEAHY